MNNVKFSSDPLPGDSWETRYSKSVVRNIVRIKEDLGITTAQLADRCNSFLKGDGEIKVSALNGLFAGKRKSLGIAECHMFAGALGVPLMAIIYPLPAGKVETRPGSQNLIIDAILDAAGLGTIGDREISDHFSLPDPTATDTITLHLIFEYWGALEDLIDANGDAARAAIRKVDEKELEYFSGNLIFPALNFMRLRKQLANQGIATGHVPSEIAWVFDVAPRTIDSKLVKAVVAPLYIASLPGFLPSESPRPNPTSSDVTTP